MPFLESLVPRRAAGADRDAAQALHRAEVVQHPAGPGVVPAFTGNGYQLKDSKYAGQQGRRHDAADAEAGAAERTTPGRRSPTSRRRQGISGILGPALNPFLSKLTLIRGLDFLPAVNHNYGGLLGNFSSCTAATPVRRRQPDRRPDHRPGDGVLAEGLSDDAGPPLPAHLAGRRRLDVVLGPRA